MVLGPGIEFVSGELFVAFCGLFLALYFSRSAQVQEQSKVCGVQRMTQTVTIHLFMKLTFLFVGHDFKNIMSHEENICNKK
jgi:hypothetical protein